MNWDSYWCLFLYVCMLTWICIYIYIYIYIWIVRVRDWLCVLLLEVSFRLSGRVAFYYATSIQRNVATIMAALGRRRVSSIHVKYTIHCSTRIPGKWNLKIYFLDNLLHIDSSTFCCTWKATVFRKIAFIAIYIYIYIWTVKLLSFWLFLNNNPFNMTQFNKRWQDCKFMSF